MPTSCNALLAAMPVAKTSLVVLGMGPHCHRAGPAPDACQLLSCHAVDSTHWPVADDTKRGVAIEALESQNLSLSSAHGNWKGRSSCTSLWRAQAVQAAQVTMEDYAMSHVGLAPLQVVGYEGLLGTIVLFGILMPIVYFIPGKDGQGLHEDSLETAYMVGLLNPLLRFKETRAPGIACSTVP